MVKAVNDNWVSGELIGMAKAMIEAAVAGGQEIEIAVGENIVEYRQQMADMLVDLLDVSHAEARYAVDSVLRPSQAR